MATMTAKMGPPSSTPPATDALNSQIVQAVQLTNAENAAYGPNQVALAPNMMITQASGLVAQSAAAYFDGASKMVLASKSLSGKSNTVIASKPATREAVTYYKVQKGDSLYLIAKRFNVDLAQLQRWNPKATHALKLGQTLTVKKAP